jgi:hypothetical protein
VVSAALATWPGAKINKQVIVRSNFFNGAGSFHDILRY